MAISVSNKLLYMASRIGANEVCARLGISPRQYVDYTSEVKPEPPTRQKIDRLYGEVNSSTEVPGGSMSDKSYDTGRPTQAPEDAVEVTIMSIYTTDKSGNPTAPWAMGMDARYRQVFIGKTHLNVLQGLGRGEIDDTFWTVLGPSSRPTSSLKYETLELII